MILYMGHSKDSMNMSKFKYMIVKSICGDVIYDSVTNQDDINQHISIPIDDKKDSRSKCTYCTAYLTGQKRTRYMCAICRIPLCNSGSGKPAKDCFSIAHSNKEMLQKLIERHHKQNLFTPKMFRKSTRKGR